MERLTGAAVCAFGLAGLATSFVPGASGPQMRGAVTGSARAAQADLAAPGAFASINSNSACMVVGLSAFAAGAALRRRRARAELTQAKAESAGLESGLKPGGPLVAYAQALMEGAAKAKESVEVAKDVLMIKDLWEDEDFLHEMNFIQNDMDTSPAAMLDKANKILKLMKLESTVMPKFIIFLAKKRRLMSLKKLVTEYLASTYQQQSISPVRVISAQSLTDEQKKSIKDKLKAKIGCGDIKLICEVDGQLLAGFRVEWGYTDPITLSAPSSGIDLTLKNYMKKKAMLQGVMMEA